ncbi:MAG: aminomethyltransferase beta-barrel domain-containing protein [Evtepia sp.]
MASPWRTNRTAWRSASSPRGITPPGWTSAGRSPAGGFVDRDGNVLGRHLGIHHYTIGQRRGWASRRRTGSSFRPFGRRRTRWSCPTGPTSWPMPSGEALNILAPPGREGPRVTVRLRHSKTETPAVFYREGSGGRLELKLPARAPTPGQLAVLYDGETVLGSCGSRRRPSRATRGG